MPSILEGLLRRDGHDDGLASSRSSSSPDTSSGNTISFGSEIIEVPFNAVLSFFGAHGSMDPASLVLNQ
jgi:hypothetical protein